MMATRPPKRAMAKNDEEFEEWKSIRKALSYTCWRTEPEGTGKAGISWLELFIWFKLHSPRSQRVTGKALLIPKPPLQKELAKFKAATRRVVTYCCNDEDEKAFKACRSSENRLAGLAIDNKHACIQGMPHIGDEDAVAIAQAILKFKKV